MSGFLESTMPYLGIGIVIYLIFRAVIWILYYKGEMRVPLWHEVGFVVLAFCLLLVFSGSFRIPVLSFLPLGFLIPFLFRRLQRFTKVFMLCAGIALGTELLQMFLMKTSFGIASLLWNLLGSFLGYFLFALLYYYLPESGSLATVKRSRHRRASMLVKRELEVLVILMLLAVAGKGAQLEIARVQAEKVAQEEAQRKAEEARKAAELAEQKRLEEEEAKKLKKSENMLSVSVEAASACLFSIEEDLIVFEKNGTQRVAPASTTKLLTALTVLNYCELGEVLTAGEEIQLVSEGATTASLDLGTRGSVETFLGAMLVPSGNDAAYALAKYAGTKILGNEEATGTEAVAAFVEAMNAHAKELDLEDSNFVNPDGDVAENHFTTSYDMVRIARACLKNEKIMELCGKAKYRALFENKDVTYKNTNLLLQSDSEYYYEGTLGLKTGSTGDTKNLVAVTEVNGMRYVAVVMQDSEEGRWNDTHTLFRALKGETEEPVE